jgi:DNA-binding NarL/FixJ family response regulator
MHTEPELSPDLLPVIVADSRGFMRGCLVSWLSRCARDLKPWATADAVKTIKETTTPPPAAVILSASPGTAGSAWLNEQAAGLRRLLPEVPIIVIMDETANAAGQELTLTANFQGFIPMSSSLEIASAALRLVIAGGSYFPHAAPGPWRPVSKNAAARTPRSTTLLELTPREQAVCELLTEGLPNKMIARRLGMAVSTVKIHVHHILEKLAVQNRTEVAIRMTADTPATTRAAANEPVA